jgi:hypothetical protein
MAGSRGDGVDRLTGQDRAAQIRVKDGARGVHDMHEVRLAGREEPDLQRVQDRLVLKARGRQCGVLTDSRSNLVQHLAAEPDHVLATEPADKSLTLRGGQQPIDRRKVAEPIASLAHPVRLA